MQQTIRIKPNYKILYHNATE